MIIFKILLWILLAILLLIVALCLLNVKVTFGNRKGRFQWKLTVAGIKIDPMRFAKKKDGHRKKDADKAPSGKKKKKSSAQDDAQTAKTEKKSVGTVLSIVAKVAETAARVLPKGFRIRLKYLDITVGGSDAAKIALDYGRYHAILSGIFALFDGYKGLFYGFRAKRGKVNIQANFLSPKTKAEYELAISFFVWQLLFSGIRIGISAIGAIIENAESDDRETETETSGEKRVSEAEKTVKRAANFKDTTQSDTGAKNGTASKNKDNGGKENGRYTHQRDNQNSSCGHKGSSGHQHGNRRTDDGP